MSTLKEKASKFIKRKFGYRIQRMKKPVFWGNTRRVKPFSPIFGYDRGPQSVARYYIDNFYAQHSSDIKGIVLEIGDDTYTRRHGTNINKSDVLHVQAGSPNATVIADLTNAPQIADNTYDCIILPQTIQCIYDFRAANKTIFRILKPGGCLLATFPGISQISRFDMDRWGEYWRFTSLSVKKMYEEIFPSEHIFVEVHGNVLAATAFLQGISSGELKKSELDSKDKDFEINITLRAVK
jgi:SAM-dependent methyltransferase